MTPWSIGGLLIILLSNLLLIWTQWQEQEAIKTINQTKVAAKPSPINISQPITLQSLSLLRGTKSRPRTRVSQTSMAAPRTTNLTPNVPYSSSPQTKKLSTALLPNSLSPELARNQYVQIKSPKQTDQSQGGSKLSYTNNPTIIKTNPLPVPSPPSTPDKIRTQQAIGQVQPLDFNHKTNKMQAIENNQDSNEVKRNMQQLQQERLNSLPAPPPEK